MNPASLLLATLRLDEQADPAELCSEWMNVETNCLAHLIGFEGCALWLRRRLAQLNAHDFADRRFRTCLEHRSHELAARNQLVDAKTDRLARALSDADAGLLLGSDSPQLFNVPGFAAHRELIAMVGAGLTPYQALRMGTSAPAEFLREPGKFGIVAPGASADLVLLDANPLEDVANTQKINGVLVRGRWLDRAFIDGALAQLEQRVSKQSLSE